MIINLESWVYLLEKYGFESGQYICEELNYVLSVFIGDHWADNPYYIHQYIRAYHYWPYLYPINQINPMMFLSSQYKFSWSLTKSYIIFGIIY